MPDPSNTTASTLLGLRVALLELRGAMLAFEAQHASALAGVTSEHRASARNLLHYIVLRKQDLRTLQTQLASVGLSSIGRSEAHALSTVDTVLELLQHVLGIQAQTLSAAEIPCDLISGADRLESNSEAVLGPSPSDRSVRIMVTMPPEAARDYSVIHGAARERYGLYA